MFPVSAVLHMGRVTTALCSSLPLPADAVPEWVHLLPAGEVRTADGRGPYRVRDVAALMSRSIAAGKLALDENHSTDRAGPIGLPSPARGWIKELQQRPDGIWGRVEWTGTGRQIMEDRQYRGVSPVIRHDKVGTISAILRASLVNDPNLTGLTALHSQETSMDFRAWLIEALGLAADVDDAAIQTALTKKLEAKPDAVALQSALAPIGALVGVAGTAGAAAVLAGVQQLKDRAGSEDATIVALQSELTSVAGRLTALTDATARKDAESFVDAAIAAGRVGVKPMRDRYISMHMRDPVEAIAMISGQPIVKSGALIEGEPDKAKDGLTAADRQVCSLMGVDPAEYAKTLAAERQAVL